MPRELKVYGWVGSRVECPKSPNGGTQTREIVAAHSVAEVIRLYQAHGGYRGAPGIIRNYGCWTGNAEEIQQAMTKPGTVFWKPLDRSGAWTEAKKS